MALPRSQIGVAIAPGSTMLTCTAPRSSRRSASLSASNAYFEAAYGPYSGSTTRPEIDDRFTIRPRARRSAGRQAWMTASCAIVLTSSWRRSSSSGTYSSGLVTAIPALLTSAVELQLAQGGDVVGVRDVELDRSRRPGPISAGLRMPA